MRIIWIEDFGEAPDPFYYVSIFFKDLLGETVLDKSWDRDGIELRDNPKALLEFCQKYSALHEVILCRHYHDFEETIANYTVLQDIDVILIDINLSAGINPAKPIPAGYKHEEGGFYIYNTLIREGFPDNNICFLTGENKTLGNFKNMCNDMSMPKPLHDFEKNDQGYKAVRKWLESKHSDAYLILRRGIITSCQQIQSLLKNQQEAAIQFGEFVKADNNSSQRTIAVQDMQDYLETLQNLLPVQKPENPQRLYKLFVRSLAHEWDAASPDNLPKCDKGDKDCFQVRTIKSTFGWIMKCARNWAAHTTVLDKLSAQDVAFLFTVAMRAMFKLSETTESHESILLNLFEKTDRFAMTNQIGTTPMNTQLPLSRTYLEVKNQIFQSKTGDALYFSTMLNNLINNQVEFDYVTGLFQMFWHGLSPVRLYDRGTTIDNNQNVVFKYSFWLNDYGKKGDGFLFELSRSIYKRSFESVVS